MLPLSKVGRYFTQRASENEPRSPSNNLLREGIKTDDDSLQVELAQKYKPKPQVRHTPAPPAQKLATVSARTAAFRPAPPPTPSVQPSGGDRRGGPDTSRKKAT